MTLTPPPHLEEATMLAAELRADWLRKHPAPPPSAGMSALERHRKEWLRSTQKARADRALNTAISQHVNQQTTAPA